MTTLGQIVSQVRQRLAGVGLVTDRVTALTQPVDASVLTLPVEDSNVGAGLVEVGMEQMRVKSATGADGTLVLWPFGRGYNGTVAAPHPAGAEVAVAPRWAASTIAAEVNGVLTELYPSLYAVKSVELPSSDTGPLVLPAEAVGVVAVFLQDLSGDWVPTDEWRWEPSSGQSLWVRWGAPSGQVRVVFAARPVLFDLAGSVSQEFVAVTGLPDRVADLLTLGVAYRLASLVDLAGNAQLGAAARADMKEQTLGSSASRLLFAQFQARVEQERRVLLQEHPVRPHRERS